MNEFTLKEKENEWINNVRIYKMIYAANKYIQIFQLNCSFVTERVEMIEF